MQRGASWKNETEIRKGPERKRGIERKRERVRYRQTENQR